MWIKPGNFEPLGRQFLYLFERQVTQIVTAYVLLIRILGVNLYM